MGAKDYDFADDLPEYRGNNRLDYRSKSSQEKASKKRKAPRSKSAGAKAGLHNRRNKHMSW